MKVALVHDHLNQVGGAEMVLDALIALYPEAPVYTLVYDKEAMGELFSGQEIRTSFLQLLPLSHKWLKWLLPLMPTATEMYNLSWADLVISSSSAFSKGIVTRPETMHICYCHTPTRYLWTDSVSYVNAQKVPGFVKWVIPFVLTYLRLWDRAAADRVDYFVANSKTVAQRIKTYYRRDSTVIYPPVAVERYSIQEGEKLYFLAGGRLVDYKRIDLVIDAFNDLGLPLKIFGDGPELEALKERAGNTIEFVGRVSEDQKVNLFENAIAYLHPQEEDFGITAVESMAAGRPVIAYAKGGATETVVDGVTGTLFTEQTVTDLKAAVMRVQSTAFNPQAIRSHAQQFSTEVFHKRMHEFVEQVCKPTV